MTKHDESRQRFELWADDQGYSLKRSLSNSDNYQYIPTQNVWQAWQEQQKKNDELQAKIDQIQGACIARLDLKRTSNPLNLWDFKTTWTIPEANND